MLCVIFGSSSRLNCAIRGRYGKQHLNDEFSSFAVSVSISLHYSDYFWEKNIWNRFFFLFQPIRTWWSLSWLSDQAFYKGFFIQQQSKDNELNHAAILKYIPGFVNQAKSSQKRCSRSSRRTVMSADNSRFSVFILNSPANRLSKCYSARPHATYRGQTDLLCNRDLSNDRKPKPNPT